MARVTPLEIILQFTVHYVREEDRAEALATAKKAEPYIGLSAKRIVDALVAGRTVPELLAKKKMDPRIAFASRLTLGGLPPKHRRHRPTTSNKVTVQVMDTAMRHQTGCGDGCGARVFVMGGGG